jgi:hypothetical protein
MNEKCFTRQRLLTFPRLGVLIVQKTVRSAHAHLADFFAQLTGDAGADHAGASAWTQARAKLKHTAFIELNEKALLANIYAPANGGRASARARFSPVAMDSSLVRVPSQAALAASFGWDWPRRSRVAGARPSGARRSPRQPCGGISRHQDAADRAAAHRPGHRPDARANEGLLLAQRPSPPAQPKRAAKKLALARLPIPTQRPQSRLLTECHWGASLRARRRAYENRTKTSNR